jgi:hypothetical protein
MLQTPDVFTFDLQELNKSVNFVVAVSHVSNKHVKLKDSSALSVFASISVFETYLDISEVLKDSTPKTLPFDEIKQIAERESNGLYQILY